MKISYGRFVFGIVTIALFCSLSFWLHTLTSNPLVLCVLAACYIVPQSSFWEWAIHGFVYHRKFIGGGKIREIHGAHHWHIFPPNQYVHNGPHAHMRMRGPLRPYRMAENKLDSAHASGGQILFHFVAGLPFIIIPTYYAIGPSFFMGAIFIIHCVLSVLFAYVHGCIHTPKNRLVERTRWFQFLDRHHYVHHIDTSVNVNFLLPVGDFVFGTLRLLKDLTEEERSRYPTFEQAKRVSPVTDGSIAVGNR